jgi:hypothetical protein
VKGLERVTKYVKEASHAIIAAGEDGLPVQSEMFKTESPKLI